MKKESFYYLGQEIPIKKTDRYRCIDAMTRGYLEIAKGRISFLMFFIVLGFAVIIIRLFYLTIMHYEPQTYTPSVMKIEQPLKRANITDRNGHILATTILTTDLSIKPKNIKNPEQIAKELVQGLNGLNYKEVLDKLTSEKNYQYIKRNLTPKERNALLWIGNPYLEEENNEKRIYPQGSLFSHILGGVDIDNNGISGIEKSYDAEIQKKDKEDIVLSLDITVQDTLRQVLKERIAKYQAEGGLGIVMNVNNGEVMGIVSLPDYNPNVPADSKKMNDRFNKATLGSYEFGSILKLFNTAMALDKGVIKPTDSFDAHKGSLKAGKKVITDFNGGEDRDLLVPEILIHSSNIASARIALKAGRDKQKEFLGRFGFYKKLPIQLPERGNVLYPPDHEWGETAVATISYGYTIQVTPLHLIAGVSALVNGGFYHLPTFIKGGNEGKVEEQLIDEKTSDQIRHMMWAVINWDLKETSPVYGYAVGGKTGTADMIDKKTNKYDPKKQRTSFIGVFPMDEPQYAVLVTMENPKKLKENWYLNNAGWTAKPTGLEVIEKIAPYLGVRTREQWKQPAYIERAIENSKEHKKRL